MGEYSRSAHRQRNYTFDEIDLMRRALWQIVAAEYQRDVDQISATIVEDQLRTYMFGGADPNELVAKMLSLTTRENAPHGDAKSGRSAER